jgi:glycosyltransferase involved in cell wall biosynthesis
VAQRKVYIAVPSIRDGVRVETMRSLIEGMCSIVQEGWGASLGESLECIVPPSLARNLAIARFLETDYDDLFFVDDDVAWQDGAMVRLLKHPVDVVAGAYPRRYNEVSFPVQWDESKPELWADPKTGLLEVHGVAAGFLRLTRHACETMVKAYAYDWYHQFGSPTKRAHALFDYELRDHTAYSEDYSFCRKWRSIGGKVWVDPDIMFLHMGQQAWNGKLGDWLKGRSSLNSEWRWRPTDGQPINGNAEAECGTWQP